MVIFQNKKQNKISTHKIEFDALRHFLNRAKTFKFLESIRIHNKVWYIFSVGFCSVFFPIGSISVFFYCMRTLPKWSQKDIQTNIFIKYSNVRTSMDSALHLVVQWFMWSQLILSFVKILSSNIWEKSTDRSNFS